MSVNSDSLLEFSEPYSVILSYNRNSITYNPGGLEESNELTDGQKTVPVTIKYYTSVFIALYFQNGCIILIKQP